MSEEILRISRDSHFYLQGNLISTKDVGDLNDYLTQVLGFYTTLDDGITLSELIHALYGLKGFIKNYFSEDYEIARAFATATELDIEISCVKFYKNFTVESDDFLDDDEYIYILPEIAFIEANDSIGYYKLGDMPVVIDEKISFSNEHFSFNKKTKFTLLEIMSCVFDELVSKVKDGKNIKA